MAPTAVKEMERPTKYARKKRVFFTSTKGFVTLLR